MIIHSPYKKAPQFMSVSLNRLRRTAVSNRRADVFAVLRYQVVKILFASSYTSDISFLGSDTRSLFYFYLELLRQIITKVGLLSIYIYIVVKLLYLLRSEFRRVRLLDSSATVRAGHEFASRSCRSAKTATSSSHSPSSTGKADNLGVTSELLATASDEAFAATVDWSATVPSVVDMIRRAIRRHQV